MNTSIIYIFNTIINLIKTTSTLQRTKFPKNAVNIIVRGANVEIFANYDTRNTKSLNQYASQHNYQQDPDKRPLLSLS
jgi:hypothetical protein